MYLLNLLQSKINKIKNAIGDLIETPVIGIDLGTVNTLIYYRKKGIVLNEPSFVAYLGEEGVNVAYLYGSKAKNMVGKTPMKINVTAPLSDGVISDFHIAESMIKKFLQDVIGVHYFIRPIVIVGVPLNATPVEKKAIQETVAKCNVKDVFLIHESMAATIGAKLPVEQPHGSMVIDIGGGTTEVSIISLGGIVTGKSIRVGGNKMDQAIMDYIRHKYSLSIGLSTAEEIKKKLGSAYLRTKEVPRTLLIRGRDLRSGTPKEINISEADLATALAEIVNSIIDVVKEVLESAGPEISSDIVDRGIVLCGGGAYIRNLAYIISEAVNLPVFVANNPELCVVAGLGKIVENYHNYDYVLFKQN